MSRPVHAKGPRPLPGILWLIVALGLLLSVTAINGLPLYYFDTVGYKIQGDTILRSFLPDLFASNTGGDGGTGGSGASGDSDNRISVARSPIYGLVVALSWLSSPPFGVVALHVVAVLATAAFCARAAGRSVFGTGGDLTLTSLPLVIAALTALPFYIAYVMPDVFAALAILIMAVVVAFSRTLSPWDLLLALVILGFAVVVHRSHLLIVGLAVPIAALAVLFTYRRRWWMAVGLIAVAAVAGVAELKTYSVAAERATGKVASINPFLTARIIADGPGYTYLQENCPDAAIATCALAEALSRSEDPRRLNPSNIIFERSEELGSFKLLSQDDQIKVAAEQRRFYIDVFLDRPVAVAASIVKNTLAQTTRTSIRMTIPDNTTTAMLERTLKDPDLDVGRLAESRDWIKSIDQVHIAIYGASLALILAICVVPGFATREMRVFAGFVIVGILINAFVCGAVSQPAARYGARVIWLLPFLATFMAIVAVRHRAALANDTLRAESKPAE